MAEMPAPTVTRRSLRDGVRAGALLRGTQCGPGGFPYRVLGGV